MLYIECSKYSNETIQSIIDPLVVLRTRDNLSIAVLLVWWCLAAVVVVAAGPVWWWWWAH